MRETCLPRHIVSKHALLIPGQLENQIAVALAMVLDAGIVVEARGVPMTYIVDHNQNIVARGMGPLDLERPDIRQLIQTLVARP